ncbi:torsin-4A-like [Hemiscyllium ocellatum]|uniref:torsin-4A-like n=1 Tax=Hemiscyllium ocellatum TaxID=170820 RepID=UPI0029669968|nr:torsin-4A-like [Hemiscyllium ocellatum]
MESGQPEKAPEGRLLHLTAKVQLAHRMMRGKGLRRAPSSRTLGWVRADGGQRQPTGRKRAAGRKAQGRRPARRCSGWWWLWRWWTCLDAESRAIHLLYLLCLTVALQAYNAYENLDDQLLAYDVEELEKTLHRELLGQTLAVNRLTGLLRAYLATYIHRGPLFLSVHGPAGVGKSHLVRLVAKHFSFQLGPGLVLLHSVRYQQQLQSPGGHSGLAAHVSDILSRARVAHRVPVLLFDELELAPSGLLTLLGGLLTSNRTAGAVYIAVSRLGQERIVRSFRARAGGGGHRCLQRVSKELEGLMGRLHPLWRLAPHVIPLAPLDRAHVASCFERLMDREGLYPQPHRAKALADGLAYYRAGRRLYALRGCSQSLAMVRQLAQERRPERLGKAVIPWHQPHEGADPLPTLNRSSVPTSHPAPAT